MKTVSDWDAVIESPIGYLGIRMQGEALAGFGYLPDWTGPGKPAAGAARSVERAVRAYFDHPQDFSGLEMLVRGTDFQQTVWRALRNIPVGRVLTSSRRARVVRRRVSSEAWAAACWMVRLCRWILSPAAGSRAMASALPTMAWSRLPKSWVT